jgi:tetratricopeptide (TPR) repeat protein
MKAIGLAAFLLAAPLVAQTTLVDQARVALDRKDAKAAVSLLEKSIAQDPGAADAHYLLGVAYGNLAEKANIFRQSSLARHARDEFERAVRLDPNHLDARFALVEYYTLAPSFFGGNQQKALEQASEIRRRDAPTGERAFEFINSGGSFMNR